MEAGLHDEVIKTLKHRFEKNMHRHIGIDWSSVQAKLRPAQKQYRYFTKWNVPAANRMSLAMMRRPASLFSMIVHPKVHLTSAGINYHWLPEDPGLVMSAELGGGTANYAAVLHCNDRRQISIERFDAVRFHVQALVAELC